MTIAFQVVLRSSVNTDGEYQTRSPGRLDRYPARLIPNPLDPGFPVIGGSPFPNSSENVWVTPDLVASVTGNHVYVINRANGANPSSFEHIHAFSVGSNGALTSVNIAPTPPVTASLIVLAVSEDGTRLYAAGVNSLTGFALDANGTVTQLASASRSSLDAAQGMVVVQ